MKLPTYTPQDYHIATKDSTKNLQYGKYLVVRKDGKVHIETWNGTGWAYNNDSIVAYYLPKIN